jgi:hypothetical protein
MDRICFASKSSRRVSSSTRAITQRTADVGDGWADRAPHQRYIGPAILHRNTESRKPCTSSTANADADQVASFRRSVSFSVLSGRPSTRRSAKKNGKCRRGDGHLPFGFVVLLNQSKIRPPHPRTDGAVVGTHFQAANAAAVLFGLLLLTSLLGFLGFLLCHRSISFLVAGLN